MKIRSPGLLAISMLNHMELGCKFGENSLIFGSKRPFRSNNNKKSEVTETNCFAFTVNVYADTNIYF